MHINYLAVLVSAVVIFLLGGLWYSPALFAKKWVALQARTMDEMSGKAQPSMYVQVFICGFLTSLVMAPIVSHMPHIGFVHGMALGAAL